MSTCSRTEFIGCLLEASYNQLWPLQDRYSTIAVAAQLLEERDLHIKAKIIHRQSVLMHLKGDVQVSIHLIRDFLSAVDRRSTELAEEDFASLCLSQANNYAYWSNFIEAHKEVRRWVPSDGCLLLWDQMFCVGRLLRGEGNFQEAKICFETCLDTPGLSESKSILVRSALADVYCELSDSYPSSSYLSREEVLVQRDTEALKGSHRNCKGLRHLLLSLVEIKIKQDSYMAAEGFV